MTHVLEAVPARLDLTTATDRVALGPTPEGLSSASFESLQLDGRPYVIKRLSYDTDWVMRAVHDTGVPRVVRMFASGLFERLPVGIDTTLVGVAFDPESGMAELLMRDASSAFLKDSNPITASEHAGLVEAMAQLHAATWGWPDDLGLTPSAVRWSTFTPAFAAEDALRGPLTGVPSVLTPMWERLRAAAPETHRVLHDITVDPGPLVRALAQTPHALIHGDVKGGNVGVHPDGRVVLVDWAFPGIEAPCADLGWYLAVNCDRLPESKEDTIERYRTSLEQQGISTSEWWDRQLPLALVGAAVQMAWSKCDQPEELAWWSARVAEATGLLR